jgi:hypothetical protein
MTDEIEMAPGNLLGRILAAASDGGRSKRMRPSGEHGKTIRENANEGSGKPLWIGAISWKWQKAEIAADFREHHAQIELVEIRFRRVITRFSDTAKWYGVQKLSQTSSSRVSTSIIALLGLDKSDLLISNGTWRIALFVSRASRIRGSVFAFTYVDSCRRVLGRRFHRTDDTSLPISDQAPSS